jgi:hypothetical protein
LTADAHFSLSLNGHWTASVIVPASATNGANAQPANTSLDDLLVDINDALVAEGIEDLVTVLRLGNRIGLATAAIGPNSSIGIAASALDPAVTQLRLPMLSAVSGSSTLVSNVAYTGLTLDHPEDQDWYRFRLAAPGAGQLALHTASENDAPLVDLYQLTNGGPQLLASGTAATAVSADRLDQGVASNDTQGSAFVIPAIADVALLRGLSIDTPGDADWFRFALSYFDPAQIVSTAAAPANGVLSGVAHFSLSIGGGPAIGVAVLADASNTSIADLVADINAALEASGLASVVVAERSESRITLSLRQTGTDQTLAIDVPAGDSAATELRFAAGIAKPPASIAMRQTDGGTNLVLEVFTAAGAPLAGLTTIDGVTTVANLAGLPIGDYLLKVSTGGGTGRYELRPSIGARGQTLLDFTGQGTATINMAGLSPDATYLLKVASANRTPTVYDLSFNLTTGTATTVSLAARSDSVRRDIIIGGDGSDVLSGGPAEDWVFGNAGNDVLSGGEDRQASDILFGGAGDDTFQLVPDALPLIKGTQETFVPTRPAGAACARRSGRALQYDPSSVRIHEPDLGHRQPAVRGRPEFGRGTPRCARQRADHAKRRVHVAGRRHGRDAGHAGRRRHGRHGGRPGQFHDRRPGRRFE